MYSSHKTCLLCNGTNLAELKNYEKDHLFKCLSCNFIFSKRIPTQDELIIHYKKYSRGGTISSITIKRYNELLDELEIYRNTNNLLDVGCGDGYFLEVAKERGWNVYGTEFSDEAIDVCKQKGITIHQGVLNSQNYNGIKFDIISSFEVIEHINNPREEIKNISDLLRVNGVFYVTTPNFNSFSRFFLGPKWNVIEYPEHLSYYTPKTIKKFFQKHDFYQIRSETTGINIRRFKQSINSPDTAYSGEILREKAETRLIYKALKKCVNSVLNFTHTGDNLKALFLKK